jgi:hypothetical protein
MSFTPAAAGASAVSSLAGNLQLYQLSQDVQRVANLAMASTVISGLGLVTALVGFAYVAKAIKRVDRSIAELTSTAEQIRDILQSQQRSQLLGAVDDYRLSSRQDQHRKELLLRAHRTFGDLAHYYKSRMGESSDLAEVQAAEGYFVIACLGRAICSSELGFWEPARDNLRDHCSDWRELARRHCESLLHLDSAEELLNQQYIEHIPSRTLVKLLDFAHDEDRGIDWLDDLRVPKKKKLQLRLPAKKVIPTETINFAKALQARDDVLQSYVEHFAFLADKKVSASQYALALEAERKQQGVDLLWVSQSEAA